MFGYHKPPDLEVGLGVSTTLYPAITESPDLRWTVSAFVVKVPAVSQFFVSSNAGIALYMKNEFSSPSSSSLAFPLFMRLAPLLGAHDV
jgi:hypothetical protein